MLVIKMLQATAQLRRKFSDFDFLGLSTLPFPYQQENHSEDHIEKRVVSQCKKLSPINRVELNLMKLRWIKLRIFGLQSGMRDVHDSLTFRYFFSFLFLESSSIEVFIWRISSFMASTWITHWRVIISAISYFSKEQTDKTNGNKQD